MMIPMHELGDDDRHAHAGRQVGQHGRERRDDEHREQGLAVDLHVTPAGSRGGAASQRIGAATIAVAPSASAATPIESSA